ncbi:MAG: VOC family protein [Ilumatobacteraceae bacterium]
MDYIAMTATEFSQIEDLDDWRFVLGGIRAHFRAGTFPEAAALAAAIADIAEAADHHPDIDIRYPDRVQVLLSTHATGGTSTLDAEVARLISETARQADAVAEPAASQMVEIAIDTMSPDAIRPFWAAALGYKDDGGNLVDPLRIGPPMWFQQMDEPRTERSRFHLDVAVPHDVADERVAAALAAGGTLVSDEHARSWWVLADADGNECCICTWQDR